MDFYLTAVAESVHKSSLLAPVYDLLSGGQETVTYRSYYYAGSSRAAVRWQEFPIADDLAENMTEWITTRVVRLTGNPIHPRECE